jgi:hypothetical protein
MLFESGFAARKQLGNPIEGCVDANSATCLINFFLEALGHCVHPPNPGGSRSSFLADSAASPENKQRWQNSSIITVQERS